MFLCSLCSNIKGDRGTILCIHERSAMRISYLTKFCVKCKAKTGHKQEGDSTPVCIPCSVRGVPMLTPEQRQGIKRANQMFAQLHARSHL